MKSADRISREVDAGQMMLRNQWYWILLLALFLCLSLVVNLLLFYNAFYRFPIKQFIWTSDAQAVCEAIPLSEPNISQARLKEFAVSAAVELNSYDYANWRALINNALSQAFTPKGRDRYRAALQESGIIQKVVLGYQTVSAVTTDPANIAEEGKAGGRYYWRVEVPLQIFYRTNVETKVERRVLEMTIVRIDPSPINPNGIAIDSVISTQQLTNQVAP
ncbi:DotI/IcmL family type IV secretion protein [Methylobacterium sp. CCH5-D2]|uniref:DotI/IcmL family type IV secretion protein n=1 Tax=Methylobacterium sp. CCH5-D2 TaxID=1768765 RepID=UPI00083778C3|nr:DotI/IcmL family type IV secretion protein [Methylobacterium sp. CCH5-D2]